MAGLEPATSASQTPRATRLRHIPELQSLALPVAAFQLLIDAFGRPHPMAVGTNDLTLRDLGEESVGAD